MTTLAEHAARIEEMKVAEKLVREWLAKGRFYLHLESEIRLLLERIDVYEASVAWHTDCLMCPKLLDLNLAQHEHIKRLEAGGSPVPPLPMPGGPK